MYYNPENDFAPHEVIVYLRKSRTDDPTLDVAEILAKHETILDEWAEKHLGAKVPEENKYREVTSNTVDSCISNYSSDTNVERLFNKYDSTA